MPQFRKAAPFLVWAILCVGCEDAGPSLSGSVTYNGSPVADGYITFTPVGSGTSFAAKITNGNYQADKVYTGQFRALITANANLPVPQTREEAAQQSRQNRSLTAAPPIPEDAEGNGQTVEITGGQQTLDFALTGPPRQ